MQTQQDYTLLLLTLAVTLALAWVLWPFFGAIFWAVVLATIFAPTYRRLLMTMGQRRNLAAVTTLVPVITLVILPLALTAASLVQESTSLYAKLQSGELDFDRPFRRLLGSLPDWLADLLTYFGVNDLGDVQAWPLWSSRPGICRT